MRTSTYSRLAAALLLVAVVASCRSIPEEAPPAPRTVQPGAPGTQGQVVAPQPGSVIARDRHTEADVRFMQNMIAHHAQALEMSSLAPERAHRDDIRRMAHRIEVSQAAEISLMKRWLERRGEEVPDLDAPHGAHAHHGHAELMAGMLTPEQLEELASATGPEFDRLFLQFMMYHHEGALQMVEELFSIPGAGQETEIFRFASHVDSDQRIEIGRMSRMLNADG